MSIQLLMTGAGAGAPPNLLGEGFYWASGSVALAARVGNYTSTTKFDDVGAEDQTTSEAVVGSAAITAVQVKRVAGAPAQIAATVQYEGTVTATYFGSADGDNWVALTDTNTGWTVHGAVAWETYVAIFADGATTYKYYRMVFSTTVNGVSIGDFQCMTAFVPSLTASIHTNLQAARNRYTDTGATTQSLANAGNVLAWTDLTAAKNFSDATGAKFKRRVSTLGNEPGIQFSDDPTNPASSYYLSRASHFSSALNTAWTCYIVMSRPVGQTNTGYLIQDTTTTSRLGFNSTGGALNAGAWAGSNTMRRSDIHTGVMSHRCSATEVHVGYNDQEIGLYHASSMAFGNDTCRLGNDSTPTLADGWNGYIACVLMYSTTHTAAQARTIRGELMAFYGDTSVATIMCTGDSMTNGFLGYNDPWYAQLDDNMTSAYVVAEQATTGHTTLQQAAAANSSGGAYEYGNSLRTTTYTSTGTPSRTVIQMTPDPGWTVNQWAGYTYVVDSGAQDGMGQVIESNTTDTITLVSPGIPTAQVSGTTARIYAPSMQRDLCIASHFIGTNTLYADADADGPTANGSVKNDTKIWQQIKCFGLALQAYGHNVVAVPIQLRNEALQDVNFTPDQVILRGWYQTDYADFAERLCDLQANSAFATIDYPTPGTYWLDNTHPTNAGGAVIATLMAAQIEAIIP